MSHRLARQGEAHWKRFLARQPIFNSERAVHGYELLYRSGPKNYYDATQAEPLSQPLTAFCFSESNGWRPAAAPS
jgi:hypothetical protein